MSGSRFPVNDTTVANESVAFLQRVKNKMTDWNLDSNLRHMTNSVG